MILKCKKETVFSVEYYDLDKFIKDEFGFDEFEVVAIEELNNDSVKSIIVNGNLYEWDEKDIKNILESKEPKMYRTGLLMNYLCKIGKIQPGKYIIKVSW